MFYGMASLTNAQTAVLRTQAYVAARSALGTVGAANTKENVMVSKLAEAYVSQISAKAKSDPNFAVPSTSAQITADPVFLALTHGGGAPVAGPGFVEGILNSIDGVLPAGYQTRDQMITSVPNYYIYGGAAVLLALTAMKARKRSAALRPVKANRRRR